MPTIRILSIDGNARAEGDLSCEVGHRVALPDGRTDGIYAGWRRAGETVHVDQDRYGFCPLFAWSTPDARVLSTDLAALLDRGAPRDLDLDALSVFLRVGFFLADDTPFRAIRALVSAPFLTRPCALSRDEAIDGFIDLTRQSIRRRMPSSDYVMPLSGGRDSRHILLELCDAGRAPRACVTVQHFPPRANDDELIAADVCARLGIEHRVLMQPPDRAAVERAKNIRTHFCTDEHAQFLVLADHLVAETAETYDGIAGDVLSQSAYLRPEIHALFERRDTAGLAAFILDGYGVMTSERALSRLLHPDIYRLVPRERALARLASEVERHFDAPNPSGSFFFWNRTRREIALSPYGVMRGVTVFAPYLDVDLYDFLSSLPASLLMDRRLHTDAIARAFPQHAAIPYDRKGVRAIDRRAMRRLAASLTGALIVSRGMFRPDAILPSLLTTIADGGDRLWYASLMLYLAQIAAFSDARAR
jgi:asparagine synthase (glutamine-hydrolysing)